MAKVKKRKLLANL